MVSVTPVDRFQFHRRKLRRKIGGGEISREADRELSLAASLQLVLENSRHEVLLGRKLDPVALAGLREALAIALMQASRSMPAKTAIGD
jgi:hypothetical protein